MSGIISGDVFIWNGPQVNDYIQYILYIGDGKCLCLYFDNESKVIEQLILGHNWNKL